MNPNYPTSFKELEDWARRNQIRVTEARVRFAQYSVLHAIGGSRVLSQALVFKGGNALDFVWQPNRSTTDLDFSLDPVLGGTNLDATRLRSLLQQSLAATRLSLGIAFNVQSIAPEAPDPEKTLVTYAVRIGYALPGEARLIRMIEDNVALSQHVRLDISINEVICETHEVLLSDTRPIRVSTLEDIIAEKLRSLLQQSPRNRYRRQDLLDIAVCLAAENTSEIDVVKVADYLQRKAAARAVSVSKSAFQSSDLWQRARVDYDRLAGTTRGIFIPFEAARAALLSFVGSLAIPED